MTDPEVKPESGEEEETVEDVSTDQGQGDATGVQIAGLMQNPEVLAALQGRLSGMIGTPSGYIQSLPKVVKRRLKALKKLQFEGIKIESKFYEEVHELECKYSSQYTPLQERRRDIVMGTVEPTDSDCDWPSDEEEEVEENLAENAKEKSAEEDDLKNKAKLDEVDETKETKADKPADNTEEKKSEEEVAEENPTGVPEFWLTIFKNVDMLSDMVQEHDEPILKHLKDIDVKLSAADPMGFTLLFSFTENTYFTNATLSKQYVMRSQPDADDPFSFEGPEIIKCTGCSIDWKKGQNVTVKTIKKIQKHKGRGTKRTVTKTMQNDSFFNFFNPPTVTEGEDADDETESLLGADFEIGHFIRERVVPRAVLYFTGEALDDDEYDDDLSDGDDDEEEDDADDEDDPDFVPGAAEVQDLV